MNLEISDIYEFNKNYQVIRILGNKKLLSDTQVCSETVKKKYSEQEMSITKRPEKSYRTKRSKSSKISNASRKLEGHGVSIKFRL